MIRQHFVPTALLVLVLHATVLEGIGQEPMKPPVAEKRPQVLNDHGVVRVDEYYWLRDRQNDQVINYLNRENEYTQYRLAPTQALQKQLVEETKNRINQTDSSVPYDLRGFTYYDRTVDGKQYPIYCRKKSGSTEGEETVLLDVNQIAEGEDYCNVSGLQVSPNNRLLAFAVDTVGRRKYNIAFRNLDTGTTFDDVIPDVTPNVVWAEDNQTLFYTRQDPETLRWYQVYRHRLGTPADEDILVYQEDDDEFSCSVGKSRSDNFIFIESSQTLSSEYRFLDANKPEGEFKVFMPREENLEYSIDHLGNTFFIRTNWQAENFRLMKTTDPQAEKDAWQVLVPASGERFLADFALFDDFLAINQLENGLSKIRFRNWRDPAFQDVDFGEPCYDAELSINAESNTNELRYTFSSLATPDSTFAIDMTNHDTKLLKQDKILGGYKPSDYLTERIWAIADDGTRIPISLIYHRTTELDGSAPCLLYGYGSYGYSMPASFVSHRFNLINRGFVYAIAHIRGGQEMGRQWYDDGKLLKKKNTFEDFIACGEHLVDQRYANQKKLYARGGSAGGLLIGASINMAPDLFDGVIADVPFVDVVTTMLDESIPLTTSEYDEWGNPNQPEYFNYMLSYSPYDQVEAKDYPNMLVTAGLHDSQVQYWEPAKWVARLRDRKTDDNLLIMKTNMSAGHGGASGRYQRYREIALRHAFLLNLANRPFSQ